MLPAIAGRAGRPPQGRRRGLNEQINQLVQAAGLASRAGRWQEAERLWMQVRAIAPQHPQALYSLGIHALQRGDTGGAVELLQAAHNAAPDDPMILLSIGMVQRERGNSDGEWQAIGAALAIDAYFLPGLLAKAAYLERQGHARAAAQAYRNALTVAPPQPQWPDMLKQQLIHAQAKVDQYRDEFTEFLAHRVGGPRAALEAGALGRWDEAASIMVGRSKPYHADCNQLCVPRLPAIPFFDRSQFAWVPELESRTFDIQREMREVLRNEQAEFTPYIEYQPGDPVNQWRELNHSRRWSTYKLWSYSQPVPEHLAHCPNTRAALEAVEMAAIADVCPNAMFSALAPHTHIPPHHGETNARLVVHLPLIVPEKCTYRVGFERREWKVGEVLIFDDSIEHEARNDSDELRVVLIFDVWNPLLSLAEREMVNAMMSAHRDFLAAR
ncbi:aspartyl/asparaginyl beta-hydroxylase domain-containing protein [Lysobacter sp. TAB13]|uniref:aspartyl/asparaginyl beta-hydroxylase domain-containing protein n=1 Tax=Lysobacter sp. TAB13 TaxID=3233065 RepID=UPI003F9CDFC5